VLRAQGASAVGAIAYGFLPTLLPQYLAYALYRWEVCVRATMVVGIVAAGGLGRRLQEQMVSFDYRGVAATLVGYVLLTVAVDAISGEARRALRAP
jgi:phosphonate transport system permease protein